MRITAAALCAALLVAAPPAPAAQPDGAETEAAWRATCHHYVNRARFKSRTVAVEAVTVLAEACPAALRSLHEPGREAVAARRFLARLTSGYAVISGINGDRFAQSVGQPPVVVHAAQDLGRAVGLVSAAGEYLILHAEGVFDALDDWALHRIDFPLHAALP